MRKIILIILCIMPSYTFADGACLIEDNSAEVLLKYIENDKKILGNIKNTVSRINNSNDSGFISSYELTREKNKIIQIFNKVFDFTSFYSYFRYYAVFPIVNEIPYQVERDYKIIEKEGKALNSYLKNISSKLSTDIIVNNPCEGVDVNCEFDDLHSKEIIGNLIKNNNKILDLYRLTIMGEGENFEGKLLLVDNNFKLEILKYYGKEAVSACNSSEGGFFEQIITKITHIKLLNKSGERGIQDWRDAWDLLLGKDPDYVYLVEREVLRDYLSEQGIGTQNQEIMENNLEKYNEGGISKNNNFITNTITSTFGKIKDELRNWKSSVMTDFFKSSKKENISYNEIIKVENSSDINIDFKEKISKLYNDEIPYATVGDISTENLRAKIIETHMSLDDTINILEKTIIISQTVCKSQDRKRGICE